MPERATSFGGVAEMYDRRRPGYPAELFDDVLGYVDRARRALEAGCGTGRATLELARRGIEVLAMEPDPQMARMARVACTGLPVTVRDGRCVDWEGPDAGFDLVVSAPAGHWVDFRAGVEVARRALAPGGVLAVWWNRNGDWTGELRDALEDAYRRLAPQLARDFRPTPAFGGGARLEGFGPLEVRTYDWEQEYDAQAYVELLQTHSDHILLAGPQREALAVAVREAIDQVGGGRLIFPYRTFLLTAARRARG